MFQSITDIIVQLMQTHLPDEFGEREKIHIAEMEQLARSVTVCPIT